VPAGEQEGATGAYYDGLAAWTAVARRLGYGGGRGELTIHRALADPAAGGRLTVTRIHDLLADALPLEKLRLVLDAGCGMGGTMIALAARCGARFTGVTLSPRQTEIGRRAVARLGLADRVEIRTQSYDEPPAARFDAVVAIESLAHARDPQASLHALAARLGPGGWIAIVDDMPLPAARGTLDLTLFQQGWRLPVLLGAAEWTVALRECGFEVAVDRDLSADLRPRSLARIATLERVNAWLRRCAPTVATRRLLDSYRGGLALERLSRDGLMSYRLLVARKLELL
jgi:SAM-dependent methyltransferase